MIYFNVSAKGPPPSAFRFRGPLNDPGLGRELARFAGEHNREIALAGLDKNGRPLRPWQIRYGRSDYHGLWYPVWTNRTVLIPFGTRSRRIDDNTTWLDRSGVRSDGGGLMTLLNGWTNRSRSLMEKWRRDGRDVLGLDPAGLEGFRKILRSKARPWVYFAAYQSFPVQGQGPIPPWRPLGRGEPLGEDTPLR